MSETSERMNRKRELLSGILNRKSEENAERLEKKQREKSNESVGSNENADNNDSVGSNENIAMNSLPETSSQPFENNESARSNESAAMHPLAATKTQLRKPRGEVYSGWFFEAAKKGKNLSGTGLLLLLDRIVPPGGRVVRVGALARSAGIHPNNIRNQLERLAENGLIESVSHGLEGRWIRLSCRDNSNEFVSSCENVAISEPCNSAVDKTAAVLQKNNTNGNTAGNVSVATYEFVASCEKMGSNEFAATGEIARAESPAEAKTHGRNHAGDSASMLGGRKRASILEGIFAAALSAGKPPEELQRRIIERLVAVAEQKSPQTAMATICEFLPAAKSDPGACLARVLDAGAEPSPARLADAEKIAEALRALRMEIGVEILPADWCKAAKVLGIVAKPEEAPGARKATISRLDAFVAAFLPCNGDDS